MQTSFGFITDEVSDEFWLQPQSAAKASWGYIWGQEVRSKEHKCDLKIRDIHINDALSSSKPAFLSQWQ